MQLKQVKLSGFKSFANPVTIRLDTQMVGIAGPNGCGKSNIVDAVRWVMGETSRHIRAAGNEDVVFSGSRMRKPLGQASVELVFDNSDGYVGGQYAGYDELSLRRTFARDHGSAYYINNVRCRRRDIMDIFMGTGLGANSYAIIEQGMIARIVEAKPEEVRGYIEEAAGVSRYKQRRHETELKIGHTRDNLSRVLDIRDEVDKQIQHLDRQAKAAERYRVLQEEKRKAELQIKILQLKLKKEECGNGEKRLATSDEKITARKNELKKAMAEAHAQRQAFDDANKQLHQVHASVYRIEADIKLTSRDMNRHQEDSSRLSDDRKRLGEQIEENKRTLEQEQQKATDAEQRCADTELKIAAARKKVAQLEKKQAKLEEAIKSLSDTHERDSGELRALSERTSNAKSKIAFCEEETVRLEQSKLDLTAQQSALGIDALQARMDHDQDAQQRQKDLLQAMQQKITQTERSLKDLRTRLHEANEQRNACRVSIQEVQGRIASTETIYEAGLGHDTTAFIDWLNDSGLSRSDFISENLVVDPGWELAVEMALGTLLEGLQVNSIDDYRRHLDGFQQGRLCLLEPSADPKPPSYPSLADKVKGCPHLQPFLQSIRLADDAEDALAQGRSLSIHESVITADGVWFKPGCLRVHRPPDSEQLTLSGRRQLNALREQHKQLQTSDVELEDFIGKMNHELSAEESQHVEQREQHAKALSELAKLETSLSHHAELIQQKNNRHEELLRMLEELRVKSEQVGTRREQAQKEYGKARQKLADFHSRHDELADTRSARQLEREDLEKLLNSAKKALQQLEIDRESGRYTVTAARDAVERLQAEHSQLKERLQAVKTTLSDMQTPLVDNKQKMAELKQKHLALKGQAQEKEAAFGDLQNRIQDLQNKCGELEEELSERRAKREKTHAQLEVSKARLDDLRETLREFEGFAAQDEDTWISELPPDLTVAACQKQISSLQGKIERLGAINLAALEEFSELGKRKEYLDSQCDDLQNALKTLNVAVQKIDQETKKRFEETVEAINQNLAQTFPSLFGGGSAHLRLTDKDPLTAGVTIMSQPPGKRLSSIRLLSGGEKTLTAIAVVFAIFNLNPAPFCLLDEVDAPLDEHNLERFCRLLRQMSQNVQVIIITHNKISMENMNQLVGVTMQEAGVSRQVSINLEEAGSLVTA